ncbi:ATP-binding protein [Rubrivivax sp. RP6-9]|uniref:ATP-binding protein n=1 Tax=Rubrivivax sp. RP6-9 TaxID=3415750 RepID=UPI003CC666EA
MRTPDTDTPPLHFGPFTLHPKQRRLLRGSEVLGIGSRALDLLVVLTERPGDLRGKAELLARVWPGTVVDEGALRVHLVALRKALGCGVGGARYIENVPRQGYRFVAPLVRGAQAGPAVAAQPAPEAASVHHLPVLPTSLIGREASLTQLQTQLPQRRLITVVGPGGIGKTALALAAARQLQTAYAQGAVFVDLAPLEQAGLVGAAVAATLGVPVLSGDPLPAIVAALQRRRLLVVLDNCEHVVAGAASLAETLVAACAGVDVLATSREPLRAAGEWVQRLPALDAGPDRAAGGPEPGAAVMAPALALLLDRASLAPAWLQAHPAEHDAAVQICRRLDGIPLAIELVATRVAAFGLRGVAERIDEHLQRASDGRRAGVDRHRTLQATLDWSHALLDDDERRALRRLAAFRGSFTLAMAVALAADEQLPASAVLASLGALVAKSLLVAEDGPADQGRTFKLLATTRQHAADRLAAAGAVERAAVLRRHARLLRDELAAAAGQLQQLGAAAWRARYGARLDDLRAALAWTGGEGRDPELLAALVASAAPLWFHLGLVHEALQQLEAVMPVLPALAPEPTRRMQLELARGHAHLHIGGAGAASDAALQASLAIATALGLAHDRLRALWGLFTERMMRGDYDAALQFAAAFEQAAAGLEDRQATLTAHRLLALALHMQGRHAEARTQAELALRPPAAEIRFLHGSAYQVDHRASALAPLARALWMQGRGVEAAALAHEGVQRAAEVGHGFSLTITLALAALPIALWNDDRIRAQAYAEQLRSCTLRHSLEFWHTWCEMYLSVIRWRTSAAAEPGGWVATCARHPGRADTLATLGMPLLNSHALQRAELGRNGWCLPEVRRASALTDLARGLCETDAAIGRLRQALDTARQQGALAWQLRLATSLAQLDPGAGRGMLQDLLETWSGDAHGADLLQAQALLAR